MRGLKNSLYEIRLTSLKGREMLGVIQSSKRKKRSDGNIITGCILCRAVYEHTVMEAKVVYKDRRVLWVTVNNCGSEQIYAYHLPFPYCMSSDTLACYFLLFFYTLQTFAFPERNCLMGTHVGPCCNPHNNSLYIWTGKI